MRDGQFDGKFNGQAFTDRYGGGTSFMTHRRRCDSVFFEFQSRPVSGAGNCIIKCKILWSQPRKQGDSYDGYGHCDEEPTGAPCSTMTDGFYRQD